MSKTKEAVTLALRMAADSSHGYDQAHRWGPDYDCSSFVIDVWERVGVKVKSGGATYTGNSRGVFLRCGFEDVTGKVNLATGSGLQPGDVLLNYRSHMAMASGTGKLVQASINELGTVTGGKTGDQTGREIAERNYYNYPWDCVLRYKDTTADKPDETDDLSRYTVSVTLPILARVDKGETVRAVQIILIGRGYGCGPDGADGDFGANTEAAVKRYQTAQGLAVDGVVGGNTWRKLLGITY